ncbi:hypothetical protein [Salinigranum salinum]|uniref:hypothetical protein n=1 Tax=Salinigranum salinum TaxID=1364937 RepID=UPI0012606E26|nr:hypothetical protein [Salinigranum salinum]
MGELDAEVVGTEDRRLVVDGVPLGHVLVVGLDGALEFVLGEGERTRLRTLDAAVGVAERSCRSPHVDSRAEIDPTRFRAPLSVFVVR